MIEYYDNRVRKMERRLAMEDKGMVQSNEPMQRALLESQSITIPEWIVKSSSVQEASTPTLINVEGCIVSEQLLADSSKVALQNFPDRTGYEAFVNHIHISDLIENSGLFPVIFLLKVGLLVSDGIIKRLKDYSEQEPFRIIISYDNSDCVVRFHKRRPGENWLADDITVYREGIILIDL